MKFKAKSEIVEAEQWFPGKEVAGVCIKADYGGERCEGTTDPHIHTAIGDRWLSSGDWIIEDGKGRRFLSRRSVFELTHEPVEEKTAS